VSKAKVYAGEKAPPLGPLTEKVWERYNSREARFARYFCDLMEAGRPWFIEKLKADAGKHVQG